MALQEGCVFPNLRFNQSMQDMNALIPQMEFQTDLDIRHVMSNSFGFGGNCSAIIFSRV
jgi:3-oxoacyl-[acyl-carrier-protein] synthase-1